jgi:hypothetical protein
LQVTDVGDRCMILRALVSSFDADRSWDLRCEVRERLITYLRNLEHGRYLVGTRDIPFAPTPAVGPSNGTGRVARPPRAEEKSREEARKPN